MFKRIIQSFVRRRSEIVTSRIEKYLSKSGKILDIGSGSGDVTFVIKSRGYNVTPVDVADFHGPRLVEPVIYDGKKLPFKDKTFDTALLLMVLLPPLVIGFVRVPKCLQTKISYRIGNYSMNLTYARLVGCFNDD